MIAAASTETEIASTFKTSMPDPSMLSINDVSSRMDLHPDLDPPSSCTFCTSPTCSREFVWSLILCSISLVYTSIPETRSWSPLNIPLCAVVCLFCVLASWPKIRGNEPLRRSLLTIAHCLTMVVFGTLYWKNSGSTPKSSTAFPCMTPALQFLFAHMAYPLRYQILPWAATIVIPFVSFSSGFVQPLPIILLVGSIVFSIISSPTILPSTNSATNWNSLILSPQAVSARHNSETISHASIGSRKPSVPMSVESTQKPASLQQYRLSRKSHTPTDPKRALEVEDTQSSSLGGMDLESQSQSQTFSGTFQAPQKSIKCEPLVRRHQSLPSALCPGDVQLLPECSPRSCSPDIERPEMKGGRATSPVMLIPEHSTIPAADLVARNTPTPLLTEKLALAGTSASTQQTQTTPNKGLLMSLVSACAIKNIDAFPPPPTPSVGPRDGSGAERDADNPSSSADTTYSKELKVQYDLLKEAYDSMRTQKEKYEVEAQKNREDMREVKERYGTLKAALDLNPKESTANNQTIVSQNERIRAMNADRSALKVMFDRNTESRKVVDQQLADQYQMNAEMKVKYDVLKEAFDVGADAQKSAADTNALQGQQLEEMTQKYNVLKQMTDRDVVDNERTKLQSSEYSRQAQEAQIKYAVLKEAFDKNVLTRRTAEDESAQHCQDRDEMKARFDMLKGQFDKEMDLKKVNDVVREQQAQEVVDANAQYDMMKKSYDLETEAGKLKDEKLAQQKLRVKEMMKKYELLKESYDAENIPTSEMEKHNLQLSEQVRELTMKYSVLKSSFDDRVKDKTDVDTLLAEQVAQTNKMSANYNALKENFDRGEKRQKMTDDVLFELRQQLDTIAAENKVLKLAFDNGLIERNRAKDTIAQQSARALEMNTKFAVMKETADRNDELRKKMEEDGSVMYRQGREMKVKFDLLKESYDGEMVEKAKAETARTQQNQEAREAKVRYGILKKNYEDEMKFKKDHEADGADRKQRLNEMEIKYEMMKAMADEGAASKRKFDVDFGKQSADMHEMKVKYDMLKDAFDEGVKERKTMQDDFNAQGESMREMKRKYGVLKVHFDKSVEDTEIDKKALAQKAEESKQMKHKYDSMKKQVDSDSIWKSKAECDLRQQVEETRRVEQMLNTAKVKLEKKTQECVRQEESLAQAASQFKVMGWMNSTANVEELEAVPELLPPLTSLTNNNVETQSQVSATQSNPMDDSSSVSNISHDIRTPLTTAISSVGILLDEKVKLTETDRRDLLSKAYASLQSVLNLVNNILDLEKLRTKTVVPQLKQVNVRRLLISQIRMIESQTQAPSSLEFILDVCSSVPTSVMIDRVLFQRVLLNLLENAARTTSESGIVTVGIRWNNETETLMGVVVDHGDGLSASERESVFSMSEGTFGRGGASLRLSVCHQLLTEMGGSLTVTSGGKGLGSTFEFRLPAPMAKNIANALELTSLVFDDDPLRRRATMEMCRYAGVDILPEATLAAAKENGIVPGLVFVTVDCGAWVETMHYWRKQKTGVCMVIPSQMFNKGYQSFPAEAYLRSPIDIVELREVLQKFAGAACQLSDASHPTSSHITSVGHSSVKKEDVPILLVEDTPVNHSLFLKQLTSMGFTNVHSAFNGLDAINLSETHSYALILMDCQMPIMDGFEATRKIREIPAHATTPIIAVSADHSSENIRQCRECGMTDFFTKPITFQTWKAITAIAAKRAAVLQLLAFPAGSQK